MNRWQRIPLAAAQARLRAGFAPSFVGGRLDHEGGRWVLSDASARVILAEPPPGGQAGDIVGGKLGGKPGAFLLLDPLRWSTHQEPFPADDAGLKDRLPRLQQRAAIVHEIRCFFRERSFLELETPARVVCPGLEPHLFPLPAGKDRWLITSPELHLKRALAAGAERIFELARVWRGEESGPWHLTEFTMLEWYRAFSGLEHLIEDLKELFPRLALAAGIPPERVPGCDLRQPFERLTVREAVARWSGIDLAGLLKRSALAQALATLGIESSAEDDWDDLFFRLFLKRVEPHLGSGRVTILSEYPASQAALAKVRPDPEWPVALRFEVYAGGVELANAFDELTDPAEQRRRHEADREHRRLHRRERPGLDETFLSALGAGHPPAAGIALGIDRLVALILGLNGLEETVAFPADQR